MRLRHLKFNRITIGFTVILFLFLLCGSGYNKYQIDAVIKDTDPEQVWSYVADFSKMRLLNPLIQDFKVIADAGNTHDWRYTVIYTEHLGHWPYWPNTITAHFQVTQSMPGIEPKSFGIISEHNTCFFKEFYCLHAKSQFKFSAVDNDTYCVEDVLYECPPFLGFVCRRELESQRKIFMHNLTNAFNNKNK